MLNFVQKSILCAKLTTCEKKIGQNFIYSPVNFIDPDSVTDTDLRLNFRIPRYFYFCLFNTSSTRCEGILVSNGKQNIH